jgi:cytochrome c peroxidase
MALARSSRVGKAATLAAVVATVAVWVSTPSESADTGNTEAKVELGRRLFFDPAVSRSGENSCAACHRPEHGFSSPERQDLDDFTNTRRHSQTLLDAADGHAFHWDGEFDSVMELATTRLGPISTRSGYGGPPSRETPTPTVSVTRDDGVVVTVDLTRIAPVADRVERDGRYASAMEAAFGSPKVSTARLAEAIAAYVHTIRSTTSAFDRFRRGDKDALSESARRGFELFKGSAGCAQCHVVGPGRATFTDGEFHDTGVAARALLRGEAVDGARGDGKRPDLGRGRLTNVPKDEAVFKTPTLRDVARRAPYMHDGSFSTLNEVVAHYARGATPNPNLDPKIRRFDASEADVSDLVAFLRSLTGEERPAKAPLWRARAKATRARFLDAAGKPIAGLSVALLDDGDRLPGDDGSDAVAREAITDADGVLSFSPGTRTHTRVALPDGLRVDQGGWIPDSCEKVDLRVPIRGRARIDLVLPASVEPPRRLRGALTGPSKPIGVAVAAAPSPDGALALSTAGVRAFRVLTERAGLSFVGDAGGGTTFSREGDGSVVGAVRVTRYVAWVAADAPLSVEVDVPFGAERASRSVSLKPDATTRIELATR